jgi:hypothetical protein
MPRRIMLEFTVASVNLFSEISEGTNIPNLYRQARSMNSERITCVSSQAVFALLRICKAGNGGLNAFFTNACSRAEVLASRAGRLPVTPPSRPRCSGEMGCVASC